VNRPEPPNILLLFADDQRFDTIAALGNDEIHTPNLDALVASGTAFTHAHIMGGSSGAVCMPSRAMLHTGRTLYRIDGQGQQIAPDHVLLGEHLRQAGYETFGCGKWHNGPAAYARSFSDGAEIFFGGMADHWNVPACRFDPTGAYDVPRVSCADALHSRELRHDLCDHITPGRHSTDLLADAACDYLGRAPADRPWFTYVSFLAPHDPRTMPPEYLDRYDPEVLTLAPNVTGGHPFDNGDLWTRDEKLEGWPRTEPAVRRHLAEYYAMITHLDAAVGRILDALKSSGQYENTIIVFAGDNGLAVGCHGLMGKQNLYDHSVRVPLILAGPGVEAGRRSDALVQLVDVFPTLCDLAGLDTPETVEGLSLAGALADPACEVRESLLLAYRYCQRGVRERRWKLIEYVVAGRRTTQLFDLACDPWERENLAGEPSCRSHVERLRAELSRWRTELSDDRPGQGKDFWQGFGDAAAGATSGCS
jgi:arylsulfatase A-like enzyme